MLHTRFPHPALLILAVALASPAPAPIVGDCPSYHWALGRSDHVAVIKVLKRLNSHDLLGADYKVHVLKTICGSLLDEQDCVVQLLSIGGDVSEYTARRPLKPFTYKPEGYDYPTTQALQLVFLREHPHFTPYVSEGEPAVAFYVNCTESVRTLHPDTDISLADKGTIDERIGALLEDSRRRYAGTVGEGWSQEALDWFHSAP